MNDQAQNLRKLVREHQLSRPADKNSSSSLVARGAWHCNSIAVTSGKGGVGKTNIALSLAVALVCLNKKILLFDADLGLANIHILLGISPKKTLADVVNENCSIEDVLYKGPGGVDILPGASGLEKMANLDAARVEQICHQFVELEKKYDYMLIDTAAGIGSMVLRFAAHADMALLVMTPEPTSLTDAYAMVKLLYGRNKTRVACVVNFASSEKDGFETFDRLNAVVVQFLKRPLALYGILPYDKHVSRYVRQQIILQNSRPQCHFALQIKHIACRLCGIPKMHHSFFSRFSNSFFEDTSPG